MKGGAIWAVLGLLLVSSGALANTRTPSSSRTPKTPQTIDSLRALVRHAPLPDSARFQALLALSDKLFAQDVAEGRRVGKQAVTFARRRLDWSGAADALYQLVVNCERAADYVAAMHYSQQGVELTRAHRPRDQWRFTQCLGLVAVDTKDAAGGLRYLRQAYRQQAATLSVGPRERGGLLLNLANTFLVLQRYDSVLHYATRALPYMQRAADARGLGYVYQFRGEVYAKLMPRSRASLAAAATNMQRALRIMQHYRYQPQAASSALSLARVYRLQGRPRAAQRTAELALALARAEKMPEYEADALSSLAWAYADQKRPARADELDARAEDLRDSLFNGNKAQALAQLQVRYDVQLLTEQKKAAEFEQRSQRAQLHSLWLLLGGLATTVGVGGGLYWRLRRQKALLALANQANCRAVAEKEVLLQEIHHRVKNNLQLVSSLLAWQRSTLPDPVLQQALASSQARIQSMALVHEFLYRADNLSQVRMNEYLGELLESLHRSLTTPQQRIQLSSSLTPLVMDPKEASALGLVVNELVTNAYKHAFQDRDRGHLHVALAQTAAGFQLTVQDDGAGLPAAGTVPETHSLGLQLVNTLARQLKASVSTAPILPTGTQVTVASV
ncbi:sensor histidine kinase [Hymenobacter metallilatus]|uniref:histidine kinase n=1 Tax=Hymenobacter metallilatus TaxID=2493666 RepID=A0A428IZU3_9BACT|nr:sensor histidine kinase [Hymenobacter metallilatus]RSK24951.1 sensor histidine kinase [Hymenobacter metallilatus]